MLKEQATNGIIWSSIERLSVQVVQFILSIIIARIVLPSDYGLIAMLGVFLAVAQVFIDGGFYTALIQKKNKTEKDYSTVFYFNILVSIFAYICLYVLSPYIADFYGEPVLAVLMKVVGLNIIINSFSIVQRARLSIQLNFKSQALASFIAVIISGIIGVWMAYHGFGVWSLAFQSVTNSLIYVFLLWRFAFWSPLLCFSLESFKSLFGFGSKLLVSGILYIIYTNLYTLVIGKRYSATDLGYYNRAFTLSNMTSRNISEILMRVVYPLFCTIQDDDERLRNSILLFLKLSCFIIFPLTVGLCVLSKPLILVLLTDKWVYVSEILPILCLVYGTDIILQINYNLLSVKGRANLTLKSDFYRRSVSILILFLTLSWGIKILCLGLLLSSILDLVIVSYFSNKVIKLTLFTELKCVLGTLVISLLMGGGIYSLLIFVEDPLMKLIVGTIFGVFFYLLMAYIFRLEELGYLIKLLKSVCNKK